MPLGFLSPGSSVAQCWILASDEISFYQVHLKELSETAKSTKSPKGENNSELEQRWEPIRMETLELNHSLRQEHRGVIPNVGGYEKKKPWKGGLAGGGVCRRGYQHRAPPQILRLSLTLLLSLRRLKDVLAPS